MVTDEDGRAVEYSRYAPFGERRLLLDGQGRPRDDASTRFAYTGHVQLLLSDLVHPGGSGAALAERLRGIAPELRALFMYDATPYPRPVTTAANAFIQKPFSLQALADKVREVLDASPEKLGPAPSL